MERVRRTLLLTDVVDSTKLSEQLGDIAMAELWAKHDRVARDLLGAHGGREIDKTDGFLMLFERPSDAVGYAIAYHRALRDLGLAARAGLHEGDVILTENAPDDVARGAKPLEVDGLAKPTAARVMSVAQGGQTLSTVAVGRRVESHGHWRMKGVSEPVELFEVGDDDGPWSPPPDGAKVYRVVERGGLWQPVRDVPHHLPAERDAFVGRARDLAELAAAFDGDARLVSVLGIGGTGKTRLALRFARTWLGDYPGGAWFCDLSEARDATGIALVVAGVLDVPVGGADQLERVGRMLAGRGRCLVVLDNFEQIASYAGETVGRWLDLAPEARFLVTTREVLGIPGEVAVALSPLDDDEARALFVARARQSSPRFTDPDPATLTALVALLDRLPLAIELCAARTRMMTVETLLDRMGQRFRLLTQGAGRHSRQQTLRATLDWSWELLSPDEQQALAQLSVFEGGLTLEAAEAVLALDPDLWPADAVQSLLDKSLLRQVGDERFDLLVSVQEYAREKLAALGGGTGAEARHGAFFGQLGDPARSSRVDVDVGLRERAVERPNLEAALRRALARQDAPTAVGTCTALAPLWFAFGPMTAAVEWATRVCALPGQALGPTAQVLARGLIETGRHGDAEAVLTPLLDQARAAGDRPREGRFLALTALMLHRRGQPDVAVGFSEQALAIARELGDWSLERSARNSLAVELRELRRYDDALENLRLALEGVRSRGERPQEASLTLHLGNVLWQLGRLDEALETQRAALALARQAGHLSTQASAGTNVAALLDQLGRPGAREGYIEALEAHRKLGNARGEANTLGQIADLQRREGDLQAALATVQRALALDTGHPRSRAATHNSLGMILRDLGRMDEAAVALESAWTGARHTHFPALEAAAAANLGELWLATDPDAARVWLERAITAFETLGDAAAIAKLRTTLGEA